MKVPVLIMPNRQPAQLELFELVPNVQVHAKPVNVGVPRHGIITWQPAEKGLFRPVLETHPPIVDVKRWDEAMYGCTKEQITALVEAGFVEGERITPRGLKINLESYFAHRARVRADLDFWSEPDRRQAYSLAIQKVVSRSTPEQRKAAARRKANGGYPAGGKGRGPEIALGASLPFSAVQTPGAAKDRSTRPAEVRRKLRETGGEREQEGAEGAEVGDRESQLKLKP